MRTATGTYTVGGTTYKYEVTMPEAIVFTHSNHIYLKVRITDGNDDAVADRQIQITTNPNWFGYEFRYTNANGELTVDMARVIQIITDNVKDEFNIDYNDAVTLCQSLIRNIQLYDKGVQFYNVRIETFNGADSVGDCWMNSAVKGARRLRWFKNYPFTFDFPNLDEVTLSVDGAEAAVSQWPLATAGMRVYAMQRANPVLISAVSSAAKSIDISALWYAFDAEGVLQSNMTNRLHVDVDSRPYNKNAVYLRWLGEHGEIYYWLFHRFQQQRDVKLTKNRRTMISDLYDDYGLLDTEQITDSKETATLTVYSEFVDKTFVDMIMTVVRSPFVDMLVSYSVGQSSSQGNQQQQEERAEGSEQTENAQEETQQQESENSDSDATPPLTFTARWKRVLLKEGSYVEDLNRVSGAMRNKQVVLVLDLPTKKGVEI